MKGCPKLPCSYLCPVLSEAGLACSPRGGVGGHHTRRSGKETQNKMGGLQAFLMPEEMQAEQFPSPERNTSS